MGVPVHSDLSCCIDNTWVLAGSDIAKHDFLSCHTYSTQVHFGVLTGVVLSPSNGNSLLVCIDPGFENPSAHFEL